MELMIITGMSGAGKSQATNALEDIGYYCVDNMPPTLMLPFLQLCRQSSQTLDKVALVTDVRSGLLFDELQQVLPQLEANADVCRILFLDCSNEALRRRFKETRRQHPLAEEGRPIEQALLLEDRTSVTVQFAKGFTEPFTMYIKYISEPENGKCVLWLSCDEYMSQTTLLRQQTATLLLKNHVTK